MQAKNAQVVHESTSRLYIIPKKDVTHFPRRSNTKNFLCEDFCDLNNCRLGNQCTRVHASLTNAAPVNIHINRMWPSREDCTYKLLKPGNTVQVKTANGMGSETIDTGNVITTRCLFHDPARPPAQCAHFYHGVFCKRGELCDFAHILRTDAFAVATPTPPLVGTPRSYKSDSEDSTPSSTTTQAHSANLLCTMKARHQGWLKKFPLEMAYLEPVLTMCGKDRFRYNPYGGSVTQKSRSPKNVSQLPFN